MGRGRPISFVCHGLVWIKVSKKKPNKLLIDKEIALLLRTHVNIQPLLVRTGQVGLGRTYPAASGKYSPACCHKCHPSTTPPLEICHQSQQRSQPVHLWIRKEKTTHTQINSYLSQCVNKETCLHYSSVTVFQVILLRRVLKPAWLSGLLSLPHVDPSHLNFPSLSLSCCALLVSTSGSFQPSFTQSG